MSAVPAIRTRIETRPNLRVVSGSRQAPIVQAMRTMTAFLLVTLVAFGASSLAGHVMVEKTRRDGIRATQRLKAAVTSQLVLAKQIDALSNPAELERWARQSGFVAPDAKAKTSSGNAILASR